MHGHGFMHRDIKPQNLMITTDGKIKLCDFGQSKIFTISKSNYSADVSTLWYRAPEIMLGCESYGYGVDIWSMGCVLAEMALGEPLFKSDCEIGQIFEIFKLTGTPKRCDFPSWSYLSPEFPAFTRHVLHIENSEPSLGNLVERMLEIDPEKRISAY